MRFVLAASLALGLAASVAMPALAAAPPPLIPRQAIFGNPERTLARISPDGKWLSWVAPRDGVMNLFLQPLAGSAPEQLTQFTKEQFYSFDLARDGRLIFTRGLMTNDIVLISDVNK